MQENRSPGPLGDTLPTCYTTRPMMPVPVQPKPMDRQRANRLRPTWQKRERLYGNTPFHCTLRRSNACRRGASRSRSVRDIRHGSSRNTNVMPWRNGPDCMRLWNLCSTAWKPLILPVLWDVAKPNFLTNRNAACFGDSPHFGISVPCPCTDFNLHGRSGSVMSESGIRIGRFCGRQMPALSFSATPGIPTAWSGSQGMRPGHWQVTAKRSTSLGVQTRGPASRSGPVRARRLQRTASRSNQT